MTLDHDKKKAYFLGDASDTLTYTIKKRRSQKRMQSNISNIKDNMGKYVCVCIYI